MNHMVKIAIIGLGQRGMGLLHDPILDFEDVEIVGLCDLYPDRVEAAAERIREKRGADKKICTTTDYHEILENPEVDGVILSAAWEAHTALAVDSMKAGKYTGLEVGGAYDVSQCWELVKAQEETGTFCMLMENCCYGRKELLALNMARQGVLGEIVHCEGGYHHDLRPEIAFGEENRHYRLQNYKNRNCDNYPTHELGPIARILNINRGNRMIKLVSVASKARGLNRYAADNEKVSAELKTTTFQQGDIVKTIITCAGGETIGLTLDTTLPRYYSRGLVVRGTKGMYEENTNSVFIDGVHEKYDTTWSEQWNNAQEYEKKYLHPIWKNAESITKSHGGMDYLIFRKFFDCVKTGKRPPIDIYDAVAWMCITPLSEESIATGREVYIPDFTRGRWMTREFEEL